MEAAGSSSAVARVSGRYRRWWTVMQDARVLTVVALFWLAFPVSSSAREGDDLTRIPWMEPEAMLSAALPVDICVDVRGGESGHRLCAGDLRIGRVPARAYFWFIQDRLTQVNLVFSSSAFEDVVGAISHQLGQPAEPSIERRRSGAVTFTNELRDWRSPSISARASRNYFGYHGDAQAWLVSGRGVADAGGALRYAAD